MTTGSARRCRAATASTMVAILVFSVGACSNDGREMRAPRLDQDQSIIPVTDPPTQPAGFDTASSDPVESDAEEFTLLLPWPSGSDLPPGFVCGGSAPTLRWSGVPTDAVGLAVVVTDLDSPIDGRPELPFVHWAVANIDRGLTALDTVPAGAVEATNDFAVGTPGNASDIGWGPPCPAAGSSHTYSFELHALGQSIELPDGTPAADMVKAIEAVSLGRATASGVVRR